MKKTILKRTPFKNKTHVWKVGTKKKTSKGLFTHLKKESKDHEWQRIKREILDQHFHSLGLFYVCELRIKDVCSGINLSYAHSKKRGDIALREPKRTEELTQVVRICTACHHQIEYLPATDEETGRQQMYRIVISVIENRNKRLDKYTSFM